MFPGRIDLFLHLFVCMVSYAVGGKFAVVTYAAFAFLHLLLLWFIWGEWFDCMAQLKVVPLWVWNLVTNLCSLFIITPRAVEWVQSAEHALKSDIDRLSNLLTSPPSDGGYRFDNDFCQAGCSAEHLGKVIATLRAQKDLADAYLTTLWWGAAPFAWGFFIVSTLVAFYLWARERSYK